MSCGGGCKRRSESGRSPADELTKLHLDPSEGLGLTRQRHQDDLRSPKKELPWLRTETRPSTSKLPISKAASSAATEAN
jgi:hypothetical protein